MRVIVMAGQGFTDAAGDFHPWGQEFSMADGEELMALLLAGTVREDDRGARGLTKPDQSESVTDGSEGGE